MHESFKESEIKALPQHEHVIEFEIEGPLQHEPTLMSEIRIENKPPIEMQLARRSLVELTSLNPDDIRNNIAFFKFARFLRHTSIYEYRLFQLSNLVYRDIIVTNFNGLQDLRHTDNLMHININTIKSKFEYLMDAQKSFIIDDFRIVNTMPYKINNC